MKNNHTKKAAYATGKVKRLLALGASLVMLAALGACGGSEITMQEIVDANTSSALLENYESVQATVLADGETIAEYYHTDEFTFEQVQTTEFFMSDNGYYFCEDGICRRIIQILPDGVADNAQLRKAMFEVFMISEGNLKEEITSTEKKDGHIVVNCTLPEEHLVDYEYFDQKIVAHDCSYLVDAKTHAVLNMDSCMHFEDGTSIAHTITQSYDTEMPEEVAEFLAYDAQTEDLRTFTLVLHPGTEDEKVETVRCPKGLPVILEADCEMYNDAACTEKAAPVGDFDSDITLYLKWAE